MPIHGYILLRFRRINQLQSLRLRIDSQQFADGGFRIQFILVLFDSLCIQRKKDCMPLRSSLISSSDKQSSSKRLPDQENFNFSSSRFAWATEQLLSKTAVIYALFLPALRMIILGSMICRNPVFLYPKIGIFYFMAKRADSDRISTLSIQFVGIESVE